MGNNLTNYSTKDIQSKLGITSDGIYGNQTTQAVKNWQAQNGLTADGIFGQKSLAKWNSLYGGGTAPQVGNTVDANQLGATQPFNIPPTQQGIDLNAMVSSYGDTVNTEQTNVTNEQNTINTNYSELINLRRMVEGEGQATTNAENQVGIPQINKDLMELQNQARQKNLEYQQAFNNVEGQKVPLGVVVGQQAQLQRQQAIDIAIANSNIQAKQGQLSLAQDSVDRAIKAQFEPIYARIETQKMILQQNYENLSSAQKKLADAKAIQLDLKREQLKEQENTVKDINSIRLEAVKNGAPNSVISALNKAKTLEEAINAGKGFLSDPLERQIKQQQLNNLVQANKITPTTANIIETQIQQDPALKNVQVENVPLVTLLKQYKDFLSSSSALGVLASPKLTSSKNSLISQITAEYKQAKKLGTLDAGVQRLIDGVLGNTGLSIWSNKAQINAVDSFLANQGYSLTDPLSVGATDNPLGI